VRAGAAILLNLLVSVLLGIPYRRWAQKKHAEAGVSAHPV